MDSGSDIQDWWSLPKDNSLSGGQIAGIVVSRFAPSMRSVLTSRLGVSPVQRSSVVSSGSSFDEERDQPGILDWDPRTRMTRRVIVIEVMYRCTRTYLQIIPSERGSVE